MIFRYSFFMLSMYFWSQTVPAILISTLLSQLNLDKSFGKFLVCNSCTLIFQTAVQTSLGTIGMTNVHCVQISEKRDFDVNSLSNDMYTSVKMSVF